MKKRRLFDRLILGIGSLVLSAGVLGSAYLTGYTRVLADSDISREEVNYTSLIGSEWYSKPYHDLDILDFTQNYPWEGYTLQITGEYYWENATAVNGLEYFNFYGFKFNVTANSLTIYTASDLSTSFDIDNASFRAYRLLLRFTSNVTNILNAPYAVVDVIPSLLNGLYGNFSLITPPDNMNGVLSVEDCRNEITSISFFDYFDMPTGVRDSFSGLYDWSPSLGNVYWKDAYNDVGGYGQYGSTLVPQRIEFSYSSTTGQFHLTHVYFLRYYQADPTGVFPRSIPFLGYYYYPNDAFYQFYAPISLTSVNVNSTNTFVATESYGGNTYPFYATYTNFEWQEYFGWSGPEITNFFENRYLPAFFGVVDPIYYVGRCLVSDRPEYNQTLYDNAYAKGKDDGYWQGYRVGYNEGQNSVTEESTAIVTLFGSVVNVPLTVLNGLSGFTVWNVPIISILFTFLFIAIFAWVIKRFI